MTTEGDQQPEPLWFGGPREEWIRRRLPVVELPDPERMDSVDRRLVRAEVLCFLHNKRVGVLTDTRLFTRAEDVAFPHHSYPVVAPCPGCSRLLNWVWYIDVRRLREVKKARTVELVEARKAWQAAGNRGPRPPTRPKIDVFDVAPQFLLDEWSLRS
jgi:hypothetical protein